MFKWGTDQRLDQLSRLRWWAQERRPGMLRLLGAWLGTTSSPGNINQTDNVARWAPPHLSLSLSPLRQADKPFRPELCQTPAIANPRRPTEVVWSRRRSQCSPENSGRPYENYGTFLFQATLQREYRGENGSRSGLKRKPRV